MASFQDHLRANSSQLTSLQCIASEETFEIWKVLEASTTGYDSKFFLYLKSSASLQHSASRVKAYSSHLEGGKLHAVLPPSHRLLEDKSTSKSKIKASFGAATVQTTTQFLLRPHEDLLKRLRSSLSAASGEQTTHRTFVQPNVDNNIQDPLAHFSTWFAQAPFATDSQNACVLLGDGGIGKTYLASQLEAQMWKNWNPEAPVPLLLKAKHWYDIDTNRKITFMDICQRALLERGLFPLAVPATIQTHWESGLFAVILDGFDELCASRVGPFNPNTLLEELRKRTSVLGSSRIVLTSRTSYWHQTIGKEDTPWLTTHTITGFGNSQRKEYFRTELRRAKLIDAANNMVHALEKDFYGSKRMPAASERITGLPYVLWLVGKLVKDGTDSDSANEVDHQAEPDSLVRVLSFICSREQRRQGFNVASDEQLAFLGDLAITCGPEFSGEEVEFCAHEAGIKALADPVSRGRLRNHILLRKASDSDRFEFALPLIRERLQARMIANHWRSTQYKKRIVDRLGESAQGDSGVLEGLVQDLRTQDWKTRIREGLGISERRSPCSSSLWHLADMLVKSQVKTAGQRTIEMLSLFGDVAHKVIRGVRLSGRICNCDFRGVRFEKCHLERVEFCGCKFDGKSVFEGCPFVAEVSFRSDCNGRENIVINDEEDGVVSRESLLCLLRDGVTSVKSRFDKGVARQVMTEILDGFVESNAFVARDTSKFDRFVTESGWPFDRARKALRANGVLVVRRGSKEETVRQIEVSEDERNGVWEFLESGAEFGAVGKAINACISN